MRASEVHEGLSAELLSRMSRERGEQIVMELERLAAEREDCEVAPPGPWVSPTRDTLCAFLGDKLVGAVVIEVAPLLDPLVLNEEAEFPAIVVNYLRLRAEGVLHERGFHRYTFAIPPSQWLHWQKILPDELRNQQELSSERLRFFRRSL